MGQKPGLCNLSRWLLSKTAKCRAVSLRGLGVSSKQLRREGVPKLITKPRFSGVSFFRGAPTNSCWFLVKINKKVPTPKKTTNPTISRLRLRLLQRLLQFLLLLPGTEPSSGHTKIHMRGGRNTLLGPSTFLNVIVFGGDLIVLHCFRPLANAARKSQLCSTSLVREVHFRSSSPKIATL